MNLKHVSYTQSIWVSLRRKRILKKANQNKKITCGVAANKKINKIKIKKERKEILQSSKFMLINTEAVELLSRKWI